MEQKDVFYRQDMACSRCRERKIRCGRERPACGNCKSDSIECDYSIPEKRVNHIKLLCHNFDRLEDRLNNIEDKLSWLTTVVKTGPSQQIVTARDVSEPTDESITSEDSVQVDAIDRDFTVNKVIIRGQDGQEDQYHGPGTLLSLCHEIKDNFVLKEDNMQSPKARSVSNPDGEMEWTSHQNINSTRKNSQSMFSIHEKCTEVLVQICNLASFEPQLEAAEDISIKLPPKQLLLMSLPQFFSQLDYSTDLFVERHLSAQIQRIYSRAPTVADDAWATAFNIIIILVLGSESWAQGNDPLMLSQFALPLFRAVQSAFHQPRLLMTPKLINVQALALLSVVAERYYPAATGTGIFSQACLLVRRTGLHRPEATPTELSEDEAQERYKTFMSLHLRDKTLCLTLSSVCWLPSFDQSPSPQSISSLFTDPHIRARLHLAEIQEELYRYLSSEPRQSDRTNSEIASIYRKLDSWARNHDISTVPFASGHKSELLLTFLGTRILAYNGSHDERDKRIIVDDARASCILLLVSYKKYDDSVLSTIQSLHLMSKTAASSTSVIEHSADKSAKLPASIGRLTSLLNAFPTIAFFQLAKHILWPEEPEVLPENGRRAHTDLELLQDVHSCVVEVNSKTQSQSRARQVERIYSHMIELIQLMRRRFDSTCSSNGPDSRLQTPNPSSLGLSSMDLAVASTLPSTDISWDFLTPPFEDAILSLDGQLEGQEDKRKRRRTLEMDFSIDGDSLVPVLPEGWPSIMD
ncbi:hypothetical protein ANO14919_033030 [Xylariales sp. No.14919]|nr:hypothetical protein ANO14919_033030 [Xylariales sp. No.14919]